MPTWGRMTRARPWGRNYGNYRSPEQIAEKKAKQDAAMQAAFAEIDARAAEYRSKPKEKADGQKIDN